MRDERTTRRGEDGRLVLGYRPDAVARDAAVVLGVAGVLLAVHYLVPRSVAADLAFRHRRVVSPTLLTAAYVHVSDAHLLGNLAGYLTGSVMAYVLCLQTGHRRWFHHTFAVLVVVLPVAVNVANYIAFAVAFPRTLPLSIGFSGVTAGFAGFTFVAFVGFLATRYDRFSVFLASQAVVLGLLAEVHYIYAGRVSPAVWTLLGAAATALAVQRVRAGGWGVPRTRSALGRTLDAAVPVVLVLAVLSYFVYALFPADVVTGDTVTNVFAHAVGFVLGASAAVVTRAATAGS